MKMNAPGAGTASLDDYDIKGTLGEGGMATVVRAVVKRTGEEVALKRMLPHVTADEVFVARFVREVTTSAALHHPHIVRVQGFGHDQGVWFLALELCAGGTLSALLKKAPKLPPQASILLLEELLDAFACAHDKGVVHRDLKPPNVLLDAGGRVKLSDFGIARTHGEQTLTATGDVIGTPAYMSPEQARGERALDGRSDLFSLGVLTYRLLAGANPHASENIATSILRVTTGPSLLIGEAIPALPSAVEDVIDGLLQKDLAKRTAKASVALAALRPVASSIRARHPTLQADLLARPKETADALFAAAADDEAAVARSLVVTSPARAAFYAARARVWQPQHQMASSVLDELSTRGFRVVDSDVRVANVEGELQARPDDPALLRKLANLHRGNNNTVQFVAALKRYLRVRPDDALAIQQLQEVLGPEDMPTGAQLSPIVGAPRPAISTASMVAGVKTGGKMGAPASAAASTRSASVLPAPASAPSFDPDEGAGGAIKFVVAGVAVACVVALVVVAKGAFDHTDSSVKQGLAAVEQSQQNLSVGLAAATQQPFVERGDRAMLLKDFQGAIEAYNFGIAADPDETGPLTATLLWGRGRAHLGLGEGKQARVDVNRAIALAPPNAPWLAEAKALLPTLPK